MFKNLLVKIGQPVAFMWLGRALLGAVFLVQILILNQYLVFYENRPSLHAFTLAYGPAMLLWAKGQINNRQHEVAAGVWFLYITPLCIQSGWIVGKLLSKIDFHSHGLDDGFLNYPLSATALVYMFLDSEKFDSERLHVQINWPVVADILDIVDLLGAIVDKEKKDILPNHVHYSICAFSIVSLVILTFSFAAPVRDALQNNNKTMTSHIRISATYKLAQAIAVNLPFLVIRLTLHFKYKAGSSAFAFKNVLVIVTDFFNVCFDFCKSRSSSSQHTPTNTEADLASVAQWTHFSQMDDALSVASSSRRPQKTEEKQKPGRFRERSGKDDPEEIIVLN